ncbi:MAG: hypothetical protein AAF125_17040 [Chloroflexota bacterium]
MPELNNFGAVFTHAIQLENGAHDFFATQGDEEHAKAAKKRVSKLERARREYVVEITLEPITDLDSDAHMLPTGEAATAETVTATLRGFYEAAAPKINVRQAQRVLEKCAKGLS